MKKGYIIQKKGFDYNDEYYYESEGGTPQLVVMDQAEAMNKLSEVEIESWKGETLGYYSGSFVEDYVNNQEVFYKALTDLGVDHEDWEYSIPKDADTNVVRRLISSCSLRLNEILEVDVVGEPVIEDSREINISDVSDSTINITGNKVLSVGSDFLGDVKDDVGVEDIKEVVKETEEDFLSIKEEMARLKEEARVRVKEFFKKGTGHIFKKFPEVKSISWSQYTPYFNDGEECVFSVQNEDFYVNGFDRYEDSPWRMGSYFEGEKLVLKSDELDYDWKKDENNKNYKEYKHPNSRSIQIQKEIESFLTQLDTDDYRTMFGDHAFVIVRENEIIVEEYDHD